MNLRRLPLPRRQFLQRSLLGAGALAVPSWLSAQVPGERPSRSAEVEVINPRGRVPVSIIIDDSTCLVNLNRFAMPQFNDTFGGANPVYRRNWRDWPVEIPDSFVREFGEWAASTGVKGKYSIVPFPACVGRIDRVLPGWSQAELAASIDLVRQLMLPNWDIHPEMVTHTRVIDLSTGHPYADSSPRFMENWEWTTGRSVDEIATYLSFALRILREVGLPCDGITTPGGFGNRALPQLAQATDQALRDVFRTEIPHYFRHVIDEGPEPVTPRVEYARGLDGPDPRCVVSLIACTGDWTGGWDCTEPEGTDRFITADGQRGRLVEVIERGEPALLLAHWTGVYWNGEKRGFEIFQEVVRRLHQRFTSLQWMKLTDIARYWAAKELTRIESSPDAIRLTAPFACPEFTMRLPTNASGPFHWQRDPTGSPRELVEATRPSQFGPGTWRRISGGLEVCVDLPRGRSELKWGK